MSCPAERMFRGYLSHKRTEHSLSFERTNLQLKKQESNIFFFNDFAIIMIMGFTETSREEIKLYLSDGNVVC